MKVGVVATKHAVEQALERHPGAFSAASARRVIEREVQAALAAGRVACELPGFFLDRRPGTEGLRLAWTASRERVYVVSQNKRRKLTTVVTVLPPGVTEAEAAA